MTVLAIDHIVATPGVCGGAPRIEGTRIRVADIATYAVLHHWSVEKIAEELELTPAQIHAALAYYYDHKDEIDQAIKAADALARQIGTSFQDLRKSIENRIPPKDH